MVGLGVSGAAVPRFGRPATADYAGWDWTKSDRELSAAHGRTIPTVTKWRHKLGRSPVKHTKYYPACEQWDWSQSDTAIAREQKVSVATVHNWRVRLNKPPAPRDYARLPPEQARAPVFDWESINWEQPDVEIAREVGCTRERARQKRAELGKPKHLFHLVNFRRFAEIFKGSKTLAYKEADSKFPISEITFTSYCRRLGIAKTPRTYPKLPDFWGKMNWAIPNILLADIWGIRTAQRVAAHRCNRQLPNPQFRFISKIGRIPEQFVSIVQEERRKAADYANGNKQPAGCESQPVDQTKTMKKEREVKADVASARQTSQ